MAIREILEYPDSRLRLSSAPVAEFDDHVRQITADLTDTMHAAKSIGLSAPQIDEQWQILVMDHTPDRSGPEVFINPQILRTRHFGLVEEHCLSVPDVGVKVLRATTINIRACDALGRPFERELSGMAAVCLQHEMDHFDGKLLVDRINWFRRRRLDAAIRKARQAA